VKQLSFALGISAAVVACKKPNEKPAESVRGSDNVAASTADAMSSPSTAADAAPRTWNGVDPLTLSGFSMPESILYDAEADVYLVSNINGKPADADDNGYISRVSPEGHVIDAKWIDGAKDNIKLDAPKGMAISNGTLYVADITVVRQFDAKTGEPKRDITIAGATFLNDIAPAPDGIYVTDSGLDASLKPNGSDAVYRVGKDGNAKPLIKNKKLANPNGVSVGDKGSVWVVTFGSDELFSIDATGKQGKPEKLPKGQLDGIVALENGELMISSKEGSAVYRGKPGGEWKLFIKSAQPPADIGWDHKRRRVLIPTLLGNTVELHPEH